MTELAVARNGVLAFAHDITHTTLRDYVRVGGHWARQLISGWASYAGYLMIVGEENIIPHWPTLDVVPNRPIDHSDFPYSDWDDDGYPEFCVGRIVGTTAANLRIPIGYSITDAQSIRIGETATFKRAALFSGREKLNADQNNYFVKDIEGGASVLRNDLAMSVATKHREYFTTRARLLGRALKRKSGGASSGADLSTFSDEQLASWLLDLFGLLPAPASGDHPFTDSEGHARRVPANFTSSLMNTAIGKAKELEEQHFGGNYGTWHVDPSDNVVTTLYTNELKQMLPNRDVIFVDAHAGGSGIDVVTGSNVSDFGLSTGNFRPVVFGFGCSAGHYLESGSLARGFLVNGAAAYGGATVMINTADFGAQGPPPGRLTGRLWINRIGRIYRAWKHRMMDDGPDNGSFTRLRYAFNLYGDPKYGDYK